MGQEIVYCFKCQIRLTQADFKSGKAIRKWNNNVCASCARRMAIVKLACFWCKKEIKASDVDRGLAFRIDDQYVCDACRTDMDGGRSSNRATAPGPVKARRAARPEPRATAPTPNPASRLPVLLGVAGGGLLAVVVFLVLSGGGGEAGDNPAPVPDVSNRKPVVVADPIPPDQPPPPPSPSLIRARRLVREDATDFFGQLAAYEVALKEVKGKPEYESVREEYEKVGRAHREAIDRETRALEKMLATDLRKEDFKSAQDRLEQASGLLKSLEWGVFLQRRGREIEATVDAAYDRVLDTAVEARRKADAGAVGKARDRIVSWGFPELTAQFDRALAAAEPAAAKTAPATTPVAPPPPPAAPKEPPEVAERRVFEERFNVSLRLAAERDYTAAIRSLEAALKEVRVEKIRLEILVEIERLRPVRALLDELRSLFVKRRRRSRIELERLDPSGRKETVQGTVGESGDWWIEVLVPKEDDRGKTANRPVIVYFPELEAGSMEALVRERGGGPDAGLLLLLEGSEKSALEMLDGKKDALPAAYWEFAGRRKPREKTGDDELEARALFYGLYPLQRTWKPTQRRGGVVTLGRRLLKEFGGTPFVRRFRDLIETLGTPAPEYVFFGDGLVGKGSFRPSSSKEVRSFWKSFEDSDLLQVPNNHVQVAYEAVEGKPYRAWALVGGCCQETMTFYLQATGLVHKKRGAKQEYEAEPGSNFAIPVTARSSRAPRSHATCRKAGRTKDAYVWTWAPIDLPDSREAGPREIRIMTNQKGFSVAVVVVSAERSRAPSERELERLDERPDEDDVGFDGPMQGLVGHWKFDEGVGTISRDSTERGIEVTLHGATWSRGMRGTCLKFDDKMAFAEIAAHQDVNLEDTFTVSLWINMTKSGRGKPVIFSRSSNRSPSNGFRLEASSRRVGYFWNSVGDKGEWGTEIKQGEWTHLAAVVDGKAAAGPRMALYVNGEQVASFTGPQDRRPPGGQAPLILGGTGRGGKDEWTYYGLIDELRIYNRMLGPRELVALAGAGAGAGRR